MSVRLSHLETASVIHAARLHAEGKEVRWRIRQDRGSQRLEWKCGGSSNRVLAMYCMADAFQVLCKQVAEVFWREVSNDKASKEAQARPGSVCGISGFPEAGGPVQGLHGEADPTGGAQGNVGIAH